MRRCLVFALAGFTLLGLLHAAHLGFYWHSLGRRFPLADVFLLELQAELSKAQLSALRMQLNPHFFFNALHTIGALVRDGNQRGAVELIERLGDVLRHVVRPDAQPDAPLRTEIEFLRKYLEIEQVRFGDRLRVSWQVDARSESVPVPPLILQPLVE